jgi:hypothetical protein
MEPLTLGVFTPHVGNGFRVRLDATRVLEVELAEAKTIAGPQGGVAQRAGEREPFALYFKGPGDSVVPQGTYRIEHDAIGGHDIFIVAIGPGRGGMIYEAIFN